MPTFARPQLAVAVSLSCSSIVRSRPSSTNNGRLLIVTLSPCLAMHLIGRVYVGVDQGSDGRMAAQPVQAVMADCGPRAVRSTRQHSRRAVVASQPGNAAGSRRLSSWPSSCSHTTWLTCTAS